jgi:hypothetical protein
VQQIVIISESRRYSECVADRVAVCWKQPEHKIAINHPDVHDCRQVLSGTCAADDAGIAFLSLWLSCNRRAAMPGVRTAMPLSLCRKNSACKPVVVPMGARGVRVYLHDFRWIQLWLASLHSLG